MDTATDTTVYERTLMIDASPETVSEFFVDPEKAQRWMGIDVRSEARRHLPLPRHSGPHRRR